MNSSNQFEYQVLSSDGSSHYNLIVRFELNDIVVRCSCVAGALGKSCRHKLELLSGNKEILANHAQDIDLRDMQVRLDGTNVGRLIKEYFVSEKQLTEAKKKSDSLKKQIEKLIR